ncbi:MAG: PadR family transcriptional regulator [Sedimentisphaerales bacterium]|nr:PadR family transcriptional regulator [Sedimentisphaerales bacterium]
MKFERELLKGVAPVVVLEILCRGAMYGYELSEAIEQRSNKVLTLGRGTLYPLLYNLEAKGLVTAEWQEKEGTRKRRYYSITSKGKEQLASQKREWEQFQNAVNLVFGLVGPRAVPAV